MTEPARISIVKAHRQAGIMVFLLICHLPAHNNFVWCEKSHGDNVVDSETAQKASNQYLLLRLNNCRLQKTKDNVDSYAQNVITNKYYMCGRFPKAVAQKHLD